tara:strand:- start:509 stop:1225 length:717 start_codon:yes stop_codon:yes gene_type:complete
MALPKLNVPQYTCKLPSSGKSIKYRPFLVKEEKLLFLAMESGENADMIDAINRIIVDCTNLTNTKDLTTFDIEYLFLQIRTRSVGESVNVTVTCPDDGKTEVSASVDLDAITVTTDPKHSKELKLTDDLILTMKYPSMDQFVKMNFGDDDDISMIDQVMELAKSCADTISDANQVYQCKDATKKELNTFFEDMNSGQFKMIQEFFETMPKLSHTMKVTNPNTGVENTIVLEGLAAFFG